MTKHILNILWKVSFNSSPESFWLFQSFYSPIIFPLNIGHFKFNFLPEMLSVDHISYIAYNNPKSTAKYWQAVSFNYTIQMNLEKPEKEDLVDAITACLTK